MNCPYCKKKDVIKAGLRNTRQGLIQKYYCKRCQRYFSDKTEPYTHYPFHVMLYALQLYNQGYPLSQVKTQIGKKYRVSPPVRTMYSWIARYKEMLSFLSLRKKYSLHPDDLTTTHRLFHQQVYPFTYHHLKLNIASKKLPQLRRYINWVERNLPTKIFLNGPRASQAKVKDSKYIKNMTIIKKDHPETTLTSYALTLQKKQQSAHEAVEEFFLLNDATTVCTELPVFLNPKETQLFSINTPLTGHIDLVQIKDNRVYIMDYKPNLNNPSRYIDQLLAYKEAVHHRTRIPKKDIIPIAFNHHSYFEYHRI